MNGQKPHYGTDAPKVIRNLLVIGIILLLIAIFLPETIAPAIVNFIRSTAFFPGIFLVISGLLMIAYAKWGKFRQRERILNLHSWLGDETVLDVGTGLGLLMIGAAKRLNTGKSYGIDIYNAEDLSNNTMGQTKLNTAIEKVSEKTIILNENIIKTSFPDNTFDVIVSNLCLHNIYNEVERQDACKEIHRILKPDGIAIISDFKHTSEYRKVFQSLGMNTKKDGTFYWDTFPPLTIITARKNNH